MLVNLNCPAFLTQDCAAVRLEDLKTKPRETMRRLCIYLNIEHEATLYQSTMQGMKWWGDPSSNLFGRTHDTDSWKDDPIRAEIGTFFSATDQYILGTLFYPLSTQFDYVQQNNPKFRDDLAKIRPLLDKPLNFEKTLAEKFLPGYPELEMTSAFKSLHALLIGRWSILEKYGTYPNMPKPLPN